MYSKKCLVWLKIFFNAVGGFILKMCTTTSCDESLYSFKPFCFKRVVFAPTSGKIPHPRSGHRIGADATSFYAFGGYNPLIRNEEYHYEDESYIDSYPLFQELWQFNFASKKWRKFRNSSSLPKELVSNALLLHKHFLMVYGGTGSPFGTRCSNQLYICNIKDDSIPMEEVRTSGQLPLPQYGQAVVYHNDYLFTIGGTTGFDYTCDIHRLSLKTLVWEAVYLCTGVGDHEPPGRYRHEVGFDGKKIYILAGGTADDVYDFDSVPAFDIEKREWYSELTKPAGRHGIPKGRRCHGAAQIDNGNGVEVFITGGLDGHMIFRDLWRLNLKSFQWTFFETCFLPRPTYFHAVTVTPQGRLYVFGGIHSIDDEVKRSNAVFSTWVCFPKLSELCWEAILYYSPDISQCSGDDLINLGLPRHFVYRLGEKSKTCKYYFF
ncbi:kelch domain-containing protein 10 homolog [Anthonomus grandis grandis]|uniref:kelch domain-containing protein 10 homolog n=1 Tax=Anthonomus grandis grandis TaxID=2921223 RepID=UPI0021652BF4|nr:kelch domain-containing protein 10 homolog [Anthonomus grandis grandis]